MPANKKINKSSRQDDPVNWAIPTEKRNEWLKIIKKTKREVTILTHLLKQCDKYKMYEAKEIVLDLMAQLIIKQVIAYSALIFK